MRRFNIKTTLRSICKNDELIADINTMAEDISKIQTLASLHIHKRSMDIILSNDPVRIRAEFDQPVNKKMFKNDFYAVKENTINPVADAEFMEWVRDAGIQLPRARNTGQALISSFEMYKTNYSNHIKMRAKTMFRKFCKSVLRRFYQQRERWYNEQLNRAVEYFFYFTNYYRLTRVIQKIIQEFNQFIRIDNENIGRGFMNHSLDGDYFYQFVKYFLKMKLYVHRYNDAHPNRKVQTIKVIPIHNFHRRCITIDTTTLRQLTRMLSSGSPLTALNPRKSDVWSNFDMSSVNIKDQYFDCQITTDGFAANICMIKYTLDVDTDLPSKIKGVNMRAFEPPAQGPPFDQIPAEVIERIDQFDLQIGIDPGGKTMAAVTQKFPNDDENCFSIEAKEHREMTGFRTREYNRSGITGYFDKWEQQIRQQSYIPITSNGRHYREFVQHKLDMCDWGWEAYHHPKVIQLKFDAHQQKLKAMYAVAKSIIGYSAENHGWNEGLIFSGNWTWKANSPISGTRTPIRLLRFCLQQLGSTVIVIDEYRTSMLCNFCSLRMIEEGRNELCVHCVPIDRSLAPAAVWQIKAHKSYLKRNIGAYKIRTYTRNQNQPLRRNRQNHSPMNWNRDYNASRAMLSKGLDLVAGRRVPRNYLRTTRIVPIRGRFRRVR